jgi:CubicO group peptidase (beta-lactamase class C family)
MNKKVICVAAFMLISLIQCKDSDQIKVLNARIMRVENSVLPAVVVKGEASGVFSISGMMDMLNIPGVSVAVINDGRIEWAKSYGLKEVGAESLDEETLFQAGSVSKPFVAMAALSLVEEGKLDLDTDINTYLKSWKVPENEFTKEEKVTLRRLLSHTAGISSFDVDDGAAIGNVPTLLQILNGENPVENDPVTVDMVPGSQWRYSNEGYAVVQQLLIDVEEKSFPEILRERVLEPLGMKHSTFEQPLPPEKLEEAASGHIGDGEPVEGKGWIYANMGAGGLWTTPSDLAKFLIEIQKSFSGESNKVLSKKMIETMMTVQMGSSGLGLGITGEGEAKSFGHSGHNRGFLCRIKAFVHGGRGVVIMANSNKAIPLLQGITFGVAKEYGWPEPKPMEVEPYSISHEELKAYAGRYVVAENYFVTISIEGKYLKITHFEGEDILIPVSDTQFYQQLDGIKLTFIKDEQGNVKQISLMDGRMKLTKVE